MQPGNRLEVVDIRKNYEEQPLLNGVSLSVAAGEMLCLLGRSGSGKSTLLRIIAGIETPDAGRVLWNGQDITFMAVHQRQFGLMFQDYALFPHLNVQENVAFGLNMQHLERQAVRERVSDALAQVNMAAFARRKVTDLSGGEQQRVALARALAPRPRLLMLDEPLAALDRTLREQLEDELRTLLERTGIPAIYVTHDLEEALALSDRLALLHEGEIVQAGRAEDIFANPVNTWVAEFLGLTNLVPGEVESIDPIRVSTALGTFTLDEGNALMGQKGTLLFRSQAADFAANRGGLNLLEGQVLDCIFQVDHYLVKVALPAGNIFDLQAAVPFPPGSRHLISFSSKSLTWIGEKS